MLKEFKAFAVRGNVLDMAVGVIIGSAFGKIVSSVVSDLIMPVFGYIMADRNFTDLKFVLSPAVTEGDTLVKPEAAILYGNFIQSVIDFLLIAFSVFLFIRLINRFAGKKEAEKAPPAPAGPTETELLSEIRDLLKKEGPAV